MSQILILVVDVDPAFAEFVKQVVEPRGWEVTKASSGLEALTLLQARPEAYSLVLAVRKLAVIDAPELLRRLEEKEITVPVILFVDHDHVHKLTAIGATAVPHALTADELMSLLEGFLTTI